MWFEPTNVSKCGQISSLYLRYVCERKRAATQRVKHLFAGQNKQHANKGLLKNGVKHYFINCIQFKLMPPNLFGLDFYRYHAQAS